MDVYTSIVQPDYERAFLRVLKQKHKSATSITKAALNELTGDDVHAAAGYVSALQSLA